MPVVSTECPPVSQFTWDGHEVDTSILRIPQNAMNPRQFLDGRMQRGPAPQAPMGIVDVETPESSASESTGIAKPLDLADSS